MALSKHVMKDFFHEGFPQAGLIIDELAERSATIRKHIEFKHLRPCQRWPSADTNGTARYPATQASKSSGLVVHQM
ncbi:hypothetical protein [Bacterioplanoides pacificum]|uniref:Uncharacterized protein n=1 Tax=Bacterioplanoides pacificum TaxID=1171596 RepID=A0ABV7VVN5_9GAMM